MLARVFPLGRTPAEEQTETVIAKLQSRAAFGEHDAPSTLLGVTTLGYRDQLVEVEAVALIGGPDSAR